MNLWQKLMNSHKRNFFLGVWPFLEIKAKGYGRVKNASYQKSNATFTHPTFDDYKLCSLAWDHTFTLKVLKMKVVFGWDYESLVKMNNAAWLRSIFVSLSQRQIAFLGPLEWRNHFGQKSQVGTNQKLI